MNSPRSRSFYSFHRHFHGRLIEDRRSIELAATWGSSGREKNLFVRVVRRMSGINFKFAAIFEQLGHALLHQLTRMIANGLAQLLLRLAPCLARQRAKHFKQMRGHLAPVPFLNVDVDGNQLIAMNANANELAGEHWSTETNIQLNADLPVLGTQLLHK